MTEITDFLKMLLSVLTRYLVILAVTYLLTAFTFRILTKFMINTKLLRLNYRDEEIPAVGGLIFTVLLPFTVGLGMLLNIKSFTNLNSVLFLFMVIGMSFLGFVDDLIGTNEYKGFKGHFKALLFEKKLTTGGFKAIFGALIAMVFAISTAKLYDAGFFTWWIILSSFLFVVLGANTINIFDLRPGRAGKVFIIAFLLIIAFSKDLESYIGLFVPILAIMLYYLRFDLKARIMLGDVGSNVLGATLGMMMAWMLTDFGKIIALIILVAIQVIAEKYSFTALIEKYGWLRYLDELGRRKNN
ncbi:MAG TPA: phospho-N-acetylmuramoyl-pentapeptide-transferase [Bacillota bacterium]|nr:phospho-N-acetylmuramoyl-pentapeptide-transferase [Bacillota bacterium]HOL09217.1 phospho-N-acetylmuramoyl-pentapeptide-transferase [Bacillota bacterium]HPO97041.1 phospho-N-acetylmuramoyl-pentapeptide-transferase [Bacillota bacterium]